MMHKIWLVFKRDLKAQLKRKGFIVTIIALVLGTAGAVFVPNLFSGNDATAIAVAESTPEGFTTLLERDDTLEVTKAADEKEVQNLVKDDEVEIGFADTKIFLNGSSSAEMQIKSIYQTYIAAESAADLGLTEAEIESILSPAPLETVNVGDEFEAFKTAIATIALIGFFILLMNVVYAAAMAVVEEKGSRIVELLVVPLTPLQLLTGKLLAFGVVGLSQVLAVGITLAAVIPFTDIDFPPGLTFAYGVLILSFILGYLIFAGIGAGMAALVSRQEEVGSVLTPLTMLLSGVYILSYATVFDPESTLASTLVVVPPFSVMLMPTRAFTEDLALWELAAGSTLALAMAVLVFWVGSVIYKRSILRTGSRLKLKDVLFTKKG